MMGRLHGERRKAVVFHARAPLVHTSDIVEERA